MKRIEAEWLINGEPREVQLEALRRSYYGYALRDSREGEENMRVLRPGSAPARGWGHLMEMRLGKTPTILNEFALFERDWSFNKLVVFSPNSYKEDWEAESEKYGLPVPMMVYEQSRLPHMRKFVDKTKGRCAFAVNYEALIYDETLDFLDGFIDDRTMLAADESIKIKNFESLFTKGAMRMRSKAGVTRIATGLPMTQGPQDFYSQGRFIGLYNGLNYYAYRGKFCKMGGFKSKKIVGAKNEEVLRDDINSVAFVAKRRDWGNQTKAEWYDVRLPLSDVQARHYAEVDRDFITWLEDGTEVSADQVMGKMMKLQQISSGFVYTEDGRAVEIMDPRKTPKMKRLLEFVSEELVGKLVVPFHYSKSGDMLLEVLKDYNPATIRGEQWMKANNRTIEAEKKRFANDPSCRIILVNISAGKYGHDLSGNAEDRCNTMIFYENTYSLDDRTQIEARNTTAFQTWSNVYFDFFCSPQEKRAISALVKKESVAEAVLGAYREGKTRKEHT